MRLLGRLLLLVAVTAPTLAAQELEQRRSLDRLRDSLALSIDTTALLALEQEVISVARLERDDPMHHLRLGLIAMRLAELRPSAPHLDHAVGEFTWAAELRPEWPWPWYGIGIAESRGRDRAGGFGGGLWTLVGQDRDRLSGEAFARAVSADPTFVRGLVEFARVALEQRIDAPIEPALRALRIATATPLGWDSELLLERGRLERRSGHTDSAIVVLTRAARLAMQTAVPRLELARTLALAEPIVGDAGQQNRDAIMRQYLEAATSAEPAVVGTIRRQLEPIAYRWELAAFDSLETSARSEWLANFWLRRDAIDLREPGSRLAEHFRRWEVATREFRLPPFRRRYRLWTETYRSGDAEFDDRGIVYIRHGEPTLRIEWPRGRGQLRVDPLQRNYGNESWRYDRPDGTLTLHFVARDDPSDFKLVDNPMELDVAIDQLERHAHEIPGLDRMIRAGEATAVWVEADVRRSVRRAMDIATRTDSWQRGYDEILAGRAQWLAAGVRSGRPLVHIVYTLDADALRQAAPGQVGDVPVRVRASFFDVEGVPVARLDTVQRVAVPRPGVELVAVRAEVPVSPGPLRLRFGVELDEAHGTVYPIDSLVAPRPDARTPELTALLVGTAGRSLPWSVTPGDTAWIDAAGVYSPHDTLSVYAEAYGLPVGEAITVRTSVTRQRSGLSRLLGGTARAVELTERLVVSEPTFRFRRELALGGLAAGGYALEFRLEAGGKVIERRRGIVVR